MTSRASVNLYGEKGKEIANCQLRIWGMMEPTAACLYGVVSGVSATIPRKHILCFRGKLENIFDVSGTTRQKITHVGQGSR